MLTWSDPPQLPFQQRPSHNNVPFQEAAVQAASQIKPLQGSTDGSERKTSPDSGSAMGRSGVDTSFLAKSCRWNLFRRGTRMVESTRPKNSLLVYTRRVTSLFKPIPVRRFRSSFWGLACGMHGHTECGHGSSRRDAQPVRRVRREQ